MSLLFSLRTDCFHRPVVRIAGLLSAVALLTVALVSLPVWAEAETTSSETTGRAADSAEDTSTASEERGRYIANDVAMCVQCHSPRNNRGELLNDRLFLGAPMPVSSPFKATPRWAFTAPNLRNATGFTEDEFLMFLMTGIRPNGTQARSPMPPFRMNRGDAKAVYDYLRSF